MRPFEVCFTRVVDDDGCPEAIEAFYEHAGTKHVAHAANMAVLQDKVFEFCMEHDIECDGVLFFEASDE